MRLGTFSVILGFAHLATCASLPIVTIKGRLDVVPSDATEGAVTILQTTSRHSSSSPSADEPIVIPVEINANTLPSLRKHRNSKFVSPIPYPVSPVPYPVVTDEDGEPINPTPPPPPQDFDGDYEPIEITESENLSSFAHPGIPYRHGKVGEINDMHVIMLAVAFLMVVIIMETWASYSRRRQGRIRLEGTMTITKMMTDEKRQLQ
ncbi:hypothetical protein QBC38DRAFT_483839 [Podospora fimiseda]|uniref:Uncharacterized protein n=1 Tax=Podospora fimiseda TaxID=252190 RepID=A0AAN7BKR0_9PEZI|nr:hypothetical protein QBC38DRAFT_483839 [Podospora fimiseda]